METKKFISLIVLLVALILCGCASWQENYGKLKTIPKGPNHLTIQDLIDKWDDYHVYSYDQYDGTAFLSPLGIMFDPKNNDTLLVGDRWKKVSDQKTLIDMTKRIFLATQFEPWLNEILGPDGLVYGYLYYSYGAVTLKMVGEKKMYIFNLEEPLNEGGEDD